MVIDMASEILLRANSLQSFRQEAVSAKSTEETARRKLDGNSGIGTVEKEDSNSSLIDSNKSLIEEAVTKLKEYVQSRNTDLNFSVDKDTGSTVVKVYNSDSNELIRQIPSEEILEISKRMDQYMEDKGNILEIKV